MLRGPIDLQTGVECSNASGCRPDSESQRQKHCQYALKPTRHLRIIAKARPKSQSDRFVRTLLSSKCRLEPLSRPLRC